MELPNPLLVVSKTVKILLKLKQFTEELQSGKHLYIKNCEFEGLNNSFYNYNADGCSKIKFCNTNFQPIAFTKPKNFKFTQ